ncbi:MAG: fasciclin domain-containing protein, partial [Gammaproteobacteria bacterium]|nr:fasciclin domain-containing protein [Gammaproteobacteria bacterium]
MFARRIATLFLAASTLIGAGAVSAMDHAKKDHAEKDHAKKMDIVDTAVDAGSFNTLVTAVKAAGLVDTLKGPGPFTV